MDSRIYVAGGEYGDISIGLANLMYEMEAYDILVYDREDLTAPVELITRVRRDGSADCVVWNPRDEEYLTVRRPLEEDERRLLEKMVEEINFALAYQTALVDMARFSSHPDDFPKDYYTFITDRRCFCSWEVFDYYEKDDVDLITFSVYIPIGRHGVYREVIYEINMNEDTGRWALSGKPVENLIALSQAEFTKRVVKTVRSRVKAERLLGTLTVFYDMARQKIAQYEPELMDRCMLPERIKNSAEE